MNDELHSTEAYSGDAGSGTVGSRTKHTTIGLPEGGDTTGSGGAGGGSHRV